MFMRSDRNSNINALRTASERCAQAGALCSTLVIIVTAILLYFGITTDYPEQKTIYFIVSVIFIIGLCCLIVLTVYYVRKLMIKENLYKMNAKNDHLHASNMSLRRQSLPHYNINEQQQQQHQFNAKQKPSYALNQQIPIVMQNSNTTLTFTNDQVKPQANAKEGEKSFGFYQI